MAERATAVPYRGVLAGLRAAAVVIIATGLNDIVAGAVPRFEPLYVYLVAIALVVWLEGVIVGIIAAAAATSFYVLLFRDGGPWLFPIGSALAVVIVVGAIRGLVRGRRRAEVVPEYVPPSPALLPPPPPIVTIDNAEVLTAIDELRGELREREAMLERNYVQAREALTSRVHVAEEESARFAGRITELEISLSASRTELEGFRRAIETEKQHAIALSGEVERARAGAESERTEAARLRVRIEELEQGLAESTASARGEVAELQRAIATRDSEAATLHARIAELEKSLAAASAARVRAEGEHANARARIAELEQSLAAESASRAELAKVRRSIESERARAEEEHASEAATLRARIAELEHSLAAESVTRAETETLRAAVAELRRAIETRDSNAEELRARIAELEQGLAEGEAAAQTEVDELRRTIEMERARADEAVAERDRMPAEFDQKLQTIVSHLAADHETDLGKAVEEREEARAEARSMSMRLSALQRKIDEEREDTARLLGETRSAAQKEIDALRVRIAELEAVPPPAPPPARPRVLIAHPDAEMRMSARASLERAGYEIVSAADGLEALRTAIAQRPDVVIADAVMPKMDGREFCQLLKSQEKTAHIRVILLTRANDDPPKGDLLPDEVLRKPVPLETLKATLATLLAS